MGGLIHRNSEKFGLILVMCTDRVRVRGGGILRCMWVGDEMELLKTARMVELRIAEVRRFKGIKTGRRSCV